MRFRTLCRKMATFWMKLAPRAWIPIPVRPFLPIHPALAAHRTRFEGLVVSARKVLKMRFVWVTVGATLATVRRPAVTPVPTTTPSVPVAPPRTTVAPCLCAVPRPMTAAHSQHPRPRRPCGAVSFQWSESRLFHVLPRVPLLRHPNRWPQGTLIYALQLQLVLCMNDRITVIITITIDLLQLKLSLLPWLLKLLLHPLLVLLLGQKPLSLLLLPPLIVSLLLFVLPWPWLTLIGTLGTIISITITMTTSVHYCTINIIIPITIALTKTFITIQLDTFFPILQWLCTLITAACKNLQDNNNFRRFLLRHVKYVTVRKFVRRPGS